MKFFWQKTRQNICLTLLLAVLCNTHTAAFWEDWQNSTSETYGAATPRADGYLQVSGMALTDGAWDDVLLCLQDAWVYDLRTGFAAEPAAITHGDAVRVVYEPAGDAFGTAVWVYLHAGEPDAAGLRVTAGEPVWHTATGCHFMTPDGKYHLRIPPEATLFDAHGAPLSATDIVPGTEMFVWANSLTASFPAQVVPQKIVLLE